MINTGIEAMLSAFHGIAAWVSADELDALTIHTDERDSMRLIVIAKYGDEEHIASFTRAEAKGDV